MNSTLRGKFTRLANLKLQIKDLETEAAKIQDCIFEKYPDDLPQQIQTGSDTKLCLSHRDNYSTPDNMDVIGVIGFDAFFKYASITKSRIQKAGGDAAVGRLIDIEALELKSVSKFYTLRKGKVK